MTPRVLAGLRVVELGTFITGPAASVLLADLGAEVIKVEKPGTGDPFRFSLNADPCNPHFQAVNRNKRSIALDPASSEDLAVFDQLVAGADVFIQNFRPGVAEKLNAGAARLQQLNPRLVYCAISGFGPTGPGADLPCFDTIAQAASGYLDLTLNPENPRVLGPAVADSITGLYAAYGILGALFERQASGRGRLVDVSMVGAMAHFNVDAFTHYFYDGEVMTPYTRPGGSQAYVLACRDHKRVALHMSSPLKFWQNLAAAIERPDFLRDPRYGTHVNRIDNHGQAIRELAEIFSRHDRETWCERLRKHDVPHSPVYDATDALDDPQAVHMRMEVVGDADGQPAFRTVRNPVVYDRHFESRVQRPPQLDQHRSEILAAIAARVDGCGADRRPHTHPPA